MKVKFIIKEQVEEAPMSTEESKQEIQAKINNIDAVLLPQILNFINSLESGAAQPTEFEAVTEKKKKDPVSKKISKLRDEGKPQDRAVAIALDMERRGKLKEEEGDWFDRLIKWLTGTKAGNTVLDTANKRRGENQVSSAYKRKK